MEIDPLLKKCFKTIEDVLERANPVDEKGERIVELVRAYLLDAKHFLERGNKETALEAVVYGHGLLDGGIIGGHIKIKGDYFYP